MAEDQQLKLDLDELRHLESIAERPRVRSFISSEIRDLEAKIAQAAPAAAVSSVLNQDSDKIKVLTARNKQEFIKCGEISDTEYSGTRWNDGPVGQVKRIAISYGSDYVYSIQITYEREGTLVKSRQPGLNRGSLVTFSLNEPLTWVSGHCNSNGGAIYSIKFGTDHATYGPFGYERGDCFSYRSDTEIVGFFGDSSSGCDSRLHAIGVYIRCPAAVYIDELPATPVVGIKSTVKSEPADWRINN